MQVLARQATHGAVSRGCAARQHATRGLQRPAARRHVRAQVVAQAGVNGTKPAAPAAAKKKVAKDLSNTPFTNTNRFIVPPSCVEHFKAAWAEREKAMQGRPGFQGFSLTNDGDIYTVSSSWATIPQWEAFSLSPECRRSHLPWGVFQEVPAKGTGFPEDFVPFIGYDQAVDAKY